MKMILCAPFLLGVILAQEPAPVPPVPPLPPQPPLPVMIDLDLKEQFKASLKDQINHSMNDMIASSIRGGIQGGIHSGLSELALQIKEIKVNVNSEVRHSKNLERNYERGTRALDRRQWDEAISLFNPVIEEGKGRADAALYWKAYALAKLGRTSEAISSLDALNQKYPQSRWSTDAKALKVEAQRAAGKPLSPEDEDDDDLKLMAINSLMRTDAERALPLLEKLIETKSSPRLRERVLFVLSQNSSPKAREIVTRIAKGSANPDLQLKAVRSLGIYGGKQNSQLLGEIYTQTNDAAIRRQVIQSLMSAGERDRLIALAKSENDPELSGLAVHFLGAMGANSELADLYKTQLSKDVRQKVISALFASGNTRQLIEIARKETDPAVKKKIIQLLSAKPDKETADFLLEFLNQ